MRAALNIQQLWVLFYFILLIFAILFIPLLSGVTKQIVYHRNCMFSDRFNAESRVSNVVDVII